MSTGRLIVARKGAKFVVGGFPGQGITGQNIFFKNMNNISMNVEFHAEYFFQKNIGLKMNREKRSCGLYHR